ncbi:glycosyltransferase [Sulfurimonas sp.]|nr:glycosyltransferase [Sulfurimonas sp.]
MDVKKRIVFLVPSMRGGGSERVMSVILNYIDKSSFDPILILLQKEGEYLSDLPKDLKIVDLNVSNTRYSMFKVIKIIFRLKPDIVMSTLGHLNILLALLKPFLPRNIKFIARESSIVSIVNKNSKYENILNYLYENIYNRFDIIISQSKYMKKDLVESYNIDSNIIKVINNPLDFKKIVTLANENSSLYNNDKFNLLIVGRLSKEKNHRAILEVMNRLNDNYHLTILGQGDLKSKLLEKVQDLKLYNKVKFIDFDNNPYKYMKQADIVVSTSFYEGFPNVLLEAIGCGTPIVAFNGKGGTSEIIEDGVNGYIINFGDIEKFSEKVIYLRENKLVVDKIKATSSKYSVDNIIKQYEEVFNAVL